MGEAHDDRGNAHRAVTIGVVTPHLHFSSPIMETWHFVRGCLWHAELTFSEVGEWRFFSSIAKEWAFEKIS